ncbi:hypothetical protein [Ralstonia soli]|uniref:Uncharacterized protein n=1 Tax=Ralstonia soli TaxID=2953896 RepID=A0ABT1AHF1_9RALS|nr:hypothetical protein [Ralstonia soli]MCO5397532.1 hypothetical protein [Ralstonia soli]
MQLKQLGIASVIVAGCLVAAGPWAQPDRIGTYEMAAQDSQAGAGNGDAGSTEGAPRFDPYTQGHRTGRFDPYTEGMGRPVVDLIWIQGNT